MPVIPPRVSFPGVTRLVLTALLAAGMASASLAGQTDFHDLDHHTVLTPEAEVRTTVRAFHAALAEGAEEEALALLHPEVRIFEQGHRETLDEYRAGHLAMDMAFARQVEREVLREEVVMGDGTALYLAEVRSRGSVGDREVDSRGVETAFLVMTPEGWRIHHFHWSSRP